MKVDIIYLLKTRNHHGHDEKNFLLLYPYNNSCKFEQILEYSAFNTQGLQPQILL